MKPEDVRVAVVPTADGGVFLYVVGAPNRHLPVPTPIYANDAASEAGRIAAYAQAIADAAREVQEEWCLRSSPAAAVANIAPIPDVPRSSDPDGEVNAAAAPADECTNCGAQRGTHREGIHCPGPRSTIWRQA